MHAMFFGIKRVHLRTVHITRALLRGIVITPARFDMMRIVALGKEHGIAQSRIQELLGVSAATVSVMLQSLEELKYIVRERMAHDARRLLVKITEIGTEVLEEALTRLIPDIAEDLALRGLSFCPYAACGHLYTLCTTLTYIRKIYGDSAPFDDPWEDHTDAVPYTHLVDGRIVYGVPAAPESGYGE